MYICAVRILTLDEKVKAFKYTTATIQPLQHCTLNPTHFTELHL